VSQLRQYVDTNSAYRKYVALLTQASADAPTAVVLENTLGNIVWTRDSAGWYYGTLAGAFTVSKTTVLVAKQYFARDTGGVYITKEVIADRNDANSVFVGTDQYDGVSSGNVPTDGVLSSTTIEIRVYQ